MNAAAGTPVGVVIATRDRREDLLASLERIAALPEAPPTVVVDNASHDGTPEAVAERFPAVDLVALDRNLGAAARNVGVRRLGTRFVALSDDDSWWEPGALRRAGEILDRFPEVGLLAARILVGPRRRLDPTSAQMRGAPPPGLPGPRIDGFVACGSVFRRTAFLQAGGFCERFLIGAEERLLAIDLRETGWELCYAEDVAAVHCPHDGDRGERSWLQSRNSLWTAWLRLPAPAALRETLALLRASATDPTCRRALLSALHGLPWALRERHRARR